MPKLEQQPRPKDSDRLHSVPGIRTIAKMAEHDSTESPMALDMNLAQDLHLSEEWNLACRVAASKGLSKSALLPKFLLYICEQSLTGNARLLTEQRIGTAIFNRPPDYNPGEDNIVRSYARTLRRRLDEYFESDGQAETMRIVVPRGGYIPVFEQLPANLPAPHAIQHEADRPIPPPPNPITTPVIASEPRQTPSPRQMDHTASTFPWRGVLSGFVMGIIIVSALWFTLGLTHEKRTQSAAHPVWAELFQQNRNAIIVPADSGLGIVQNLTGHLVPLEEYTDGSYFSDNRQVPGVDAASLTDLREQRYTSVVSLNIATRLMQLPEVSPGHTEIRFARSITTEDLKTANVILLGSSHTNPWVSLFEDKLNFPPQYTPQVDHSYVLNKHPQGAEQRQYFNGIGRTKNQTYGVVDYLPNLEGTGHVLIIQGLNMAATQAAADTLFNSSAMQFVLKQATRPNGSLRPFELLIRTSSIGATNPGSQIIATRFYP
ncbi:hypothetical protein GOB94_06575 [Granulicella sp. 5B5]|uniref:hypothetical protein n=1 Tax=Granulicella sp. 5B5 TaxID=1617967 RepID=UPI0015F40F22|nr:hypothetical protein [Granulicella sp. 5B5]QMV18384.1 hypothetical protein GOB94_06575 [Granulicella sp. 5B5]